MSGWFQQCPLESSTCRGPRGIPRVSNPRTGRLKTTALAIGPGARGGGGGLKVYYHHLCVGEQKSLLVGFCGVTTTNFNHTTTTYGLVINRHRGSTTRATTPLQNPLQTSNNFHCLVAVQRRFGCNLLSTGSLYM